MTETIKFEDWKKTRPINENSYVTITKIGLTIHSGDRSNEFIAPEYTYKNKLLEIDNFLNYFMNVYYTSSDYVDSLLEVRGWFKNPETFPTSIEDFALTMCKRVLQPSIVEAALRLVDDNYIDFNTGKIDPIFNSKHLMIISTMVKLILPISLHYYDAHKFIVGKKNPESDSEILFKLFKPVFSIVEKETAGLFEDLKKFSDSRVKSSFKTYKSLYEFAGKNENEVANWMFKKVIIGDTLFKCTFDKNPFSFIYVVIDTRLSYIIYSHDEKENK